MKKINLAIIGCGWAGDIHATDLGKIPDLFNIVACCDPDQDRRNQFGDRYGIPIRVSDYAQVLAMADVEVVVLCTPPMLHHPMIIEALKVDKNVICEKPLTSSLMLVDSIVKAEKKSKGRVMPIFQYRFGEGANRVRHVIKSGLAGKHYVSSIDVARTRSAEYYSAAWRGKFATELGGVHVTQSIHINDLLFWMIGPAASVMSLKATRVNPIEVEDCAVISMRMADGSLASMTSTLGSVGQLTRIRMCFENVTFERNSDHDATKPAQAPWTVLPRTEAIGIQVHQKMAELSPSKEWFARQYELFYQSLMSGKEFPVTLSEARAAIEFITALYYSDETGSAVDFPIPTSHPRYAGWVL